ncbi:MAG: hypothetical protein H7A35_05075 [Planctomycetales bacterium]|nr:hypothetical protein [bacterium]UNM09430.1 MAG: hypothetical protein H7A35_05075 [Planctomycetales bacterium]
MDSRRGFIAKLGLAMLAIPFAAGRAGGQENEMTTDGFTTSGSANLGGSFAVDPEWERDNQELIRSFVLPCHFGLDQAREVLKQDSRLVNARYFDFDEAPIEAASHMGRTDIAKFLLGNGAPYTVHCSVMMGHLEAARSFFDADAAQAVRPGAHTIPMMFHAAISGSIPMAELLEQYGGGQDYDWALCGAAGWHHPEMVEWMLGRGADPNYVSQKKTALDWSLQRGEHQAVLAILRKHGAKSAEELGLAGNAAQ